MKRTNLRVYPFLISFLFLLSCSKKENLNDLQISEIESSLSSVESEGTFEGEYLFFKDVSYGPKASVHEVVPVFGLIVAIILQVFYNYIVAKIDSIVNDMEDASITLIDILVAQKK